MAFIDIKDILDGGHDGEIVSIRGWIHRTRSSGKLAFPIIRDPSGTIQTIVSKADVDEEYFTSAKKALIESSVEVTGKAVADDRAGAKRLRRVDGHLRRR